MDLKEYFKNTNGFGVLSTADDKGKVDAAAYAKPKVINDKKIAFIMGDKLTHANLRNNPYAVYLFREDGPGYEGKRLYLKKYSEIQDEKTIEETCKDEWPGPYCAPRYLEGSFLVHFNIESVLPLVIHDKK